MPRKAGWILDRGLKLRCGVAVGHNIEPVAITPILGHSSFVRREEYGPGRVADALDLDEPQLSGVEVKAGDVVAQVFVMDIIYLAALRRLIFHHDSHGGRFGLSVRLQPPYLRGFTLWVREDQYARQALDSLQGQRPLPLQLLPPPLSPGKELTMPGLRLRQASFGPWSFLLDIPCRLPDLFIRFL